MYHNGENFFYKSPLEGPLEAFGGEELGWYGPGCLILWSALINIFRYAVYSQYDKMPNHVQVASSY